MGVEICNFFCALKRDRTMQISSFVVNTMIIDCLYGYGLIKYLIIWASTLSLEAPCKHINAVSISFPVFLLHLILRYRCPLALDPKPSVKPKYCSNNGPSATENYPYCWWRKSCTAFNPSSLSKYKTSGARSGARFPP